MRGAKSYSGGHCIYKMSYVFIWLSRGRRLKVVVLWVPTLLPLRKVTSWSSTSGFLFPTGFSQGVSGGSLGGVFSSLRATSQWRSSMNCHSLASPRSQGSPAIDMGSSHLGGGNWGMVEVPPPIWCWRLGTRRFCIPYNYKDPHMGGRGRRHSKSNRFFT